MQTNMPRNAFVIRIGPDRVDLTNHLADSRDSRGVLCLPLGPSIAPGSYASYGLARVPRRGSISSLTGLAANKVSAMSKTKEANMSKFNFNRKASVSVAALEVNNDQGDEGYPAFSQENYNEFAKEMRSRFPTETKALSNEKLYALVMEQDDDRDDDHWRAIFAAGKSVEAPSGIVNTDSEGETQKARAIAFASQEGEEMSAAIELVANAKEDWQGGPIKVLFALNVTYGDELSLFPKPDLASGNNPDKFKVPMTNDAGVTAMRATSFYQQFADATKEGRAIVEELGFLKRLGNVNDKKEGIPSPIIDAYLDDEDKRTSRVNYLTGRRSTIRASYKKAMALFYQMDAVASLPHVGCDFDWVTDNEGNDTEEVENTTKPILVWERPAEGKPVKKKMFFSIGSFLKLDAKEASEKGGTLKELIKTVARDTNTKAAEIPTIKTAETYVKALVECFRAIDEFNSDADQKEMGKLMKIINTKGADELKVAIVEYRNYLDDICDELKLSAWYADLQAKRSPLVTRKAS
jgi:hypothetical protein